AAEQSVSVTLAVTPAPDFTLVITPATQTVVRGSSTGYTILVEPQNGFAGRVALSVSGVPAGVSATLGPRSLRVRASTLVVQTTTFAEKGSYTLEVTGKSGSLKHKVTASLVLS